ncbi:MAG: hypothetical protein KF760_34110 [Candidatus Eremiobacteraeota bacterium]|nr:hypothetical protein [Candidatus Eremiobacteraeota bacterium]MCW5871075.1 hypothetical protein [Candidatus Eremiobacteraeota bacterium]
MSTPLEDDMVAPGDLIEAIHISQLFPIIEALEENQTNYREDVGLADAYKVDFSGAGNANEINAYQAGQQVVFKAAHANTGASTLQVAGPAGDLSALPLTKNGGEDLEAGDIQAGQMVLAIYNDEGSGRFDALGVLTGGDAGDGSEFFREDDGAANAYQVDATGMGSNPFVIEAYAPGQLVVFKAAHANTGASTLQVVAPGGALSAKALTKFGNTVLEAGDIQANQIVMAVYNDTGSGRFEMMDAPPTLEPPEPPESPEPEDGTGFYREDDGYSDTYEVDCSGWGSNPNVISAYETGQLILFRAGSSNTGACTLEVFGPGGGLGSKELTKFGSSPLDAGDIQADQIVMAVYNDTGDGRFEMMEARAAGSGGAGAWLYGDGMDGDELIDSNTDLWEHKYYRNLTIDPGVFVCTNGFKVHVSGTLTNNGLIHNNGTDGEDSVGSTPGWAGHGRNYGQLAWEGHWGGTGSLQEGDTVYYVDEQAYFARGGDGGDGSYGGGGSGDGGNVFGGDRFFMSSSAFLSGLYDGDAAWHGARTIGGGMGGGGGTGNDDDAAGGSGGGSGGILWIAARALAGDGELQAVGGSGGAAGGADAGGGGGGGGGIIYLLTEATESPYSYNVDGGIGGAGGGGSGTDGGDGEMGLYVFRGGM